MRIYVASPLGFSEAGRLFYYERVIPLLAGLGHDVLDPWVLTPQAEVDAILAMDYGAARRDAWRALNDTIAARNAAAIDACDAVLAILDGPDVDSGTAAEVGYAAALGKRIVGYRGDTRLSADNEGATVNLQVEHFIRRTGGTIVARLDDVPAAVAALGIA